MSISMSIFPEKIFDVWAPLSSMCIFNAFLDLFWARISVYLAKIFASLIMKECVSVKKIFKKTALGSGVIFPLLKVGFEGSVSPEKIFDAFLILFSVGLKSETNMTLQPCLCIFRRTPALFFYN